MNKYTISYTVFDPTSTVLPKPEHRKYSFESDDDLLAAADEGMSAIFEQYPAYKGYELLFRGIELTNAREVYDNYLSELERQNAQQQI